MCWQPSRLTFRCAGHLSPSKAKFTLSSRPGITGWYDILSRRGDTVGAIELDIAIAEWRPLPQADDDDVIPTSPEPLSPPRSPPSRGPNSRNFEFSSARIRKLSRALPRAARKQEELMARLTVSVEEVVLPKEGGRADGLQELLGDKRTPPERFYAVHGRYGEAEPCVSRAVPAVAPHEQGSTPPESDVRRSQNGLNFSVPLEHTCEVTAPFDDAFSEYLKDRLAVGIWRVDNRRDPSGRNLTSGGGSRERGRDRLVGTAYVGLSPLLDHGVADLCVSGGSGSGGVSEGVRNSGRQESEAPGAASLSGAFALVHPDAVNLGNARLKVRVLLQLTAKEKEETQPGGHGQEPFGFRSRSLEASREQLSPMAESGSPDVTLGLGDVAGVTSEGESEEGLEKEEEGFGERSLSPERGSEASDDVDEEEWLQQRALRRSAELLRRSKDARAGNVFAENGPDVEEIEGVSEEKEGNAYRTVETRVRSPERAASPMRTEESGGSRRATRMEEKGENNASGLLSEGGEEEFEVSRGPAKRLAGHVTVTAPPKRGPARATGVPISDSRPTPSVEGEDQCLFWKRTSRRRACLDVGLLSVRK